VYHAESTTDAEDGHGVEQLLHVERTLQFLCAKENKPTLQCIAGAMLIAPKFVRKSRNKLLNTLRRFKHRLPHLAELQAANRVLALQMQVSEAPIDGAQAFRESMLLKQEQSLVSGKLHHLEQQMAHMQQILQQHVHATSSDPPVSAGATAFSNGAGVVNDIAVTRDTSADDDALTVFPFNIYRAFLRMFTTAEH
jgi:hypothetical protein